MTPAVMTITGGGGISPSTTMCLLIVATMQAMAPSRPFLPGQTTRALYMKATPTMTCAYEGAGRVSIPTGYTTACASSLTCR